MSPWTEGLRTTQAPGDQVLAQVEVEARVEHVEPRAHHLDPVHRAGVDLQAAAVADEDHDRQARGRGAGRAPAGGAGPAGAGEARAGEPHRLGAGDAEAAEQQEELVGVPLRLPGGDQAGGVDLGVRPLRGGRGGGRSGGRRVGIGGVGGDAVEGRRVGGGGGVDLVDGGAAGVEELQAAAGAGAGVLVEGVAEAPVAQEEAQVDLADHLAHGALDGGRGEAAVDLVDAGLVAGQRHDLAGFGQAGEQRAEAFRRLGAAQAAGRAGGAAGLEKRGFGHAERRGGVAHARGGAAGAQRGLAGEEVVGSVRRGVDHRARGGLRGSRRAVTVRPTGAQASRRLGACAAGGRARSWTRRSSERQAGDAGGQAAGDAADRRGGAGLVPGAGEGGPEPDERGAQGLRGGAGGDEKGLRGTKGTTWITLLGLE